MKVTVKLNLKPESANRQMRNLPTEKESNAPNFAECKCGQRFVAFPVNDSREYVAYQEALSIAATKAMVNAGHAMQMKGALKARIIIAVRCPECHAVGLDAVSMGKKPSAILEGVEDALKGIVFSKPGQITAVEYGRVYRKKNSIEIEVSQVTAADIDSECKQMELF